MKLFSACIFFISLLCASNAFSQQNSQPSQQIRQYQYKSLFSASNWWDHIKSDYINFYTPPNIYYLLGTFSIGATFAFTNADQQIANYWQNHIRSKTTNDIAKVATKFGTRTFALTYVAALGVNLIIPRTTVVGKWASNAIRAGLVGLPVVGLFELALGGDRPVNKNPSSRWRVGRKGHSISGHAFGGALPFLTAAMMTDNKPLKYTLYALSTLTGLSRINDNAHYFSQVFMGWMVAYLSVKSVMQTNSDTSTDNTLAVYPIVVPGGAEIGIAKSF